MRFGYLFPIFLLLLLRSHSVFSAASTTGTPTTSTATPVAEDFCTIDEETNDIDALIKDCKDKIKMQGKGTVDLSKATDNKQIEQLFDNKIAIDVPLKMVGNDKVTTLKFLNLGDIPQPRSLAAFKVNTRDTVKREETSSNLEDTISKRNRRDANVRNKRQTASLVFKGLDIRYNENLKIFFIKNTAQFASGDYTILGNPKLDEDSYNNIKQSFSKDEYKVKQIESSHGECTVLEPEKYVKSAMFYEGCKTLTKDLHIKKSDTELPETITKIKGCIVFKDTNFSTKEIVNFFKLTNIKSENCLIDGSKITGNKDFCPDPETFPQDKFSKIKIVLHDDCQKKNIKCKLDDIYKDYFFCTSLSGELIRYDSSKKKFYDRLKTIEGRILIENVTNDLSSSFKNLESAGNRNFEPAIVVKNTPNPPLFPKLQTVSTYGNVAIDIHGKKLDKTDFDRFLQLAGEKKALMDCSFTVAERNITDLTKIIGCGYFSHGINLNNISKDVSNLEIQEIQGCLNIYNMTLDKLDLFSPSIKISNCSDKSKVLNSPKICELPSAKELKKQNVDFSECPAPNQTKIVSATPNSKTNAESQSQTAEKKEEWLNLGLAIGCSVGGLLLIGLAGGFFYYLHNKKRGDKKGDDEEGGEEKSKENKEGKGLLRCCFRGNRKGTKKKGKSKVSKKSKTSESGSSTSKESQSEGKKVKKGSKETKKDSKEPKEEKKGSKEAKGPAEQKTKGTNQQNMAEGPSQPVVSDPPPK